MRRNNTLVILGAGDDQVPVYLEAKKMGYSIIGIDQKKKAPGAELADVYLRISTRDTQQIMSALEGSEPCGIIAPASDASQKTLYELTRHYQTPYQPSLEATLASNDKGYFLRIVHELAFSHHQFVQSRDEAVLLQTCAAFSMPVVVKPSDSSGSKGICRVDQQEKVALAIAYAQRTSFCGDVIIEEYIAGKHYSVELFLRAGQIHFMAMSEKEFTEFPSFITKAHRVPARIEDRLVSRLRQMIGTICNRLLILNGPVNFDFIVSPDAEIFFIEMGARLGGNGLPQLLEYAFGVQTAKAAIQTAVGESFDLTPTRQQKALLYILRPSSTQTGTLKKIEGVEALLARREIKLLEIFPHLCEKIHPFMHSADKLGYLVICADTEREVEETLSFVLQTLNFEIEADTMNGELHASY